MSKTTGSIRKLTIGGVTFDVMADTNVTVNLSPFETEGMPTSGETMFKMTFRTPTMEAIALAADSEEAESLRAVAELQINSTMSMELADASTWKGSGRINFENYETEEGRANIILIPNRSRNAWTRFSP